MNEILIPNASRYASRLQIDIGETLGSGKHGIVLVAAQQVLNAFEGLGIYLLDVSPANIAFTQ